MTKKYIKLSSLITFKFTGSGFYKSFEKLILITNKGRRRELVKQTNHDTKKIIETGAKHWKKRLFLPPLVVLNIYKITELDNFHQLRNS